MTIFLVYYIYALIQYGRWLHENYADLEHKEVWQSLLFVASLFVVYEFYFTNPGEMAREYLAQVETLVIIIFLLWRVETLQELDAKEVEADEMEAEAANTNVTIPLNIGSLLLVYCEAPQLYLQHDLTLTQLAGVIGTNRTYLSQYFAQQGMTYNTYINRLRIDHFEYLYNEAVQAHRSLTAQQLAVESGFKSYSTFAAVFKQFKGQTVSAWMKEETDL
jgi:AraC-like DNA-binding protein